MNWTGKIELDYIDYTSYNDGYNGRLKGLSLDDNPYIEHSNNWVDFRNGWYRADNDISFDMNR